MVFFATPHRGASNASFVKNILRMMPWTPEPTLGDLEPGSALIEDINERFRNNSEDLELVSFYETHPTSIRGLFSTSVAHSCVKCSGAEQLHSDHREQRIRNHGPSRRASSGHCSRSLWYLLVSFSNFEGS